MKKETHLLIWFNPYNLEYYSKFIRLRSQYDIGDINKFGHILVNVIHIDTRIETPVSLSFNDFDSLSSYIYLKSLRYDRLRHLPKRFKKGLGDYLVRVGKRLNK